MKNISKNTEKEIDKLTLGTNTRAERIDPHDEMTIWEWSDERDDRDGDGFDPVKNKSNFGKGVKCPARAPDKEEMKEKLLVYVCRKLKKDGNVEETEARNFFRYLGLEQGNLRQMLEIQELPGPLSGCEYKWAEVYGKNPVLDIFQYMKDKCLEIQRIIEKRKNEIVSKIREYIFPSVAEKENVVFAVQMLNHGSDISLAGMIRREKEKDYSYLLKINRSTYEEIRMEDDIARLEKAGIFGNREECIDDIFSSVDDFIRQRYEIYRYKAVETIYKEILDDLGKRAFSFCDGEIPEAVARTFDVMKIMERFSEEYLCTFSWESFVDAVPYEEFMRCYADVLSGEADMEKGRV